MTAPHVVVVGGGLAGLTAAIACQDAGVRVTLFEARARLGGATWSTRHRGLVVDNGQHVFLRCCRAYRALLARLGVADRVVLQERLAVPVAAPGGPVRWIRRHALPAPAHLAPSLLRFSHVSVLDRLRAARTVQRLAALDLENPRLDEWCFGDWLRRQGERDVAIDGFWDLLIRPTLNLPAREASLALAAKVYQTGLLEQPDGADVGWSAIPLSELHEEPAAKVLRGGGAVLHRRTPVEAIEPGSGRPALRAGGERVEADAIVLAVPHGRAADLLPRDAGIAPESLRALGTAPIVNLHVVFDRPVLTQRFLAGIGTPLEWIFDRTQAAGLERGQYLAVSLSAADAWLGRSVEELRRAFVPAFQALLPVTRRARILDFFTTREPTATFRQAPGTRRLRPGPDTARAGLHLAGAWTDTGWPATMEGAVLSGRAAASSALRALGRSSALPHSLEAA